MIDEGLCEVGTHLDDSDAGLGLRVRDVEARAAWIVQAHVADAEVAQLAVSHAAIAKNPNDERATHVVGGPLDSEAPCVVVDGGLRQAEFRRDRAVVPSRG